MKDKKDWVVFTKRTEDPKLAWIESKLSELGIESRRNGHSFHAPILEVQRNKLDQANAFLASPFDEAGKESVDDMPDDHPTFLECDYESPQDMGWLGKDGKP